MEWFNNLWNWLLELVGPPMLAYGRAAAFAIIDFIVVALVLIIVLWAKDKRNQKLKPIRRNNGGN
jgi:hypothetical protein